MKKKRKQKKTSLGDLNRKLDQILRLEKKQFEKESSVERLEKRQLKELDELEELEKEIKSKVGKHPLRRITYKDLGKALIGAFFGIVSHYAVLEGIHFAQNISVLRASGYYVISYFIGFIFLYYTGFRQVKQARFLALLPIRLTFIYIIMLLAVISAIYIFSYGQAITFIDMYKQVAVVSLPAIMGASAADLIGND